MKKILLIATLLSSLTNIGFASEDWRSYFDMDSFCAKDRESAELLFSNFVCAAEAATQLEATNTELQGQLDGANTRIAELEGVNSEIQGQLEGAKGYVPQIEEANTELQGQLDGANSRIAELEGMNSKLHSRLAGANTRIAELVRMNSELQGQLEEAKGYISQIEDVNAALRAQSEDSNTAFQSQLEWQNSQVIELQGENAALKMALDDANGQIAALRAHIQNRPKADPAEIQKLKQQIQDLQRELSRYADPSAKNSKWTVDENFGGGTNFENLPA